MNRETLCGGLEVLRMSERLLTDRSLQELPTLSAFNLSGPPQEERKISPFSTAVTSTSKRLAS